ncbi:MAG: peptide chain release factor N(5)-glutamine methyltransferase [Candidatus Hydrogenedentes bacterium]|jgi:release factor glutamine methyltransferase|nr:peptide chain release factor N(5)-glutamine methyltransferase [Candidatus Hydrogenedentota bacterium]
MKTIADTLSEAAARLAPVTDTPRLDAEILLSEALGTGRAGLLVRLRDETPESTFEDLLERRLASEPIAYILGEWEFFSLSFLVEPPALVPRPETEHLVEVVLDEVWEKPCRVLEIGTGTGCVAVSIAKNRPACFVTATDIGEAYIRLAENNARRHGVHERVRLLQGDLFAALDDGDAQYDILCSNPPYIEEGAWEGLEPVVRGYEDKRALLAGPDGLDVIRRLVSEGKPHLRDGGLLALEIGMGQYEGVRQLLEQDDYREIGSRMDLAGIPRIATARAPG